MSLFTAVEPLFAKVAAVPLDEDPAKWSSQILQELYRQVPEASEYNPQILMLREDHEQGFALGVVVISGQTDSALSMASSDSPTSKRALIPVVIKNNELSPLDIIITADKKMYPLNGSRLREALFRPNTFDMMTDDQGDQSLYSLFYPPGRSSNSPGAGFAGGGGGGEGGAGYVMGPGMKSASAMGSIMLEVLPTLSQVDLDALGEKVASLGLSDLLRTNRAFLSVMQKIAAYDGYLLDDADVGTIEGKIASQVSADVAQFGHTSRLGYWVKTASRGFYAAPGIEQISRGDLLKIAGEEVASKVDGEGTVTVSEPIMDAAPLNTSADRWEVVEKPGVYRVRDINGTELTGWVLPGLIDFDGTKLPMAAFTNGAAAAVQSDIVGSKISDGSLNLPSAAPQGSGLFYVTGANTISATVPFKIVGTEAAMDGSNVFHVVSMTGTPHAIRMVEGLKAMVPGDAEVMMPASAKFLPFNKEAPVPLLDNLDAVKTSSYAQPYIAIRHGGDIVDLTFHELPVLAACTNKQASLDDAVFTLCAAGMNPQQAHGLIKHAERTMRTEYAGGVRDVQSQASRLGESSKAASDLMAEVRLLRRAMLKEAAILPDIQTVDSVLSLNYINPENIRLYVGKLPYLDRALNTVCELTLFSRLGMSEVPESASARAGRALDEVIQGLKGLAMRSNDGSAVA